MIKNVHNMCRISQKKGRRQHEKIFDIIFDGINLFSYLITERLRYI